MKFKNYEEWEDKVWMASDDNHILRDGVYDVSSIDVIVHLDTDSQGLGDFWKELKQFIKDHPNYCVGSAYQTYSVFLLSSKPPLIDRKNIVGSGFNYGSCNLIKNCPEKILILAEDD